MRFFVCGPPQDTLEPHELTWLCARRHKPQAVSQVLTKTLWGLDMPDYQKATADLQARTQTVGKVPHAGFNALARPLGIGHSADGVREKGSEGMHTENGARMWRRSPHTMRSLRPVSGY